MRTKDLATASTTFSPSSILYEDNHLLIAYKPCGLSTQNDDKSSTGLPTGFEDQVKQFLKIRDMKKGGVFLSPIFRLDKPVSGIVLFAKSQKALSRLQESQRARKYTKEYVAIVSAVKDAPLPGLCEDFIIHDEYKARIVHSASSERDVKHARLRIIHSEKLSENIYVLRIELLTGRYHQIRAQLSSRGWPILGDTKYGGIPFKSDILQYTFHNQAIALHHRLLSFYHPVKKEGIEEEAPITIILSAPWE